MEILSYAAEQGDSGAAAILTTVRKPIHERLNKGLDIARSLIHQIYQHDGNNLEPERRVATVLKPQPLIARHGTVVKRPKEAMQTGCLRVGETDFGCLCLQQSCADWPAAIRQKLLETARNSATEISLHQVYDRHQLAGGEMAQRRFWSAVAAQGVKTVLVVSDKLGDQRKTQLKREALQAGIALQFMRPMPAPDEYRADNITLGLLVKAGWQPVGLKMPDHPQAAELTIGFDAGTNQRLFYGTSAFAVLADGQSLGWEIPEAQLGERFSGQAIWHTTLNIVERFYNLNGRFPKRILLLRDGLVCDREFDYTLVNLEQEGMAVDLLEVHKSGAGRMAKIIAAGKFQDVQPGTGFSIADDAFRIVTSQAHAGGSARPLEVVKIHGDASLKLLASEIFALSQFHPASAFTASRLPMPLHYADKLIKEVQRLGQLGILHGVDRQKIFAA